MQVCLEVGVAWNILLPRKPFEDMLRWGSSQKEGPEGPCGYAGATKGFFLP